MLSVIVCVLSKYCSLHLHSEYGQTPLACLVVQGCCYLVTTATVTLGQAVPSGSQGTFTQDCFTHFTDHTKRGSLSVYKKGSNLKYFPNTSFICIIYLPITHTHFCSMFMNFNMKYKFKSSLHQFCTFNKFGTFCNLIKESQRGKQGGGYLVLMG